MRRLGCILFVLPLFAPTSGAQNLEIPAEVTAYVDARNFAVVFSLPEERAQLARYDSPQEVREKTGSERLADVFTRMRFVEDVVVELDPQMAHPMGPGGELTVPPEILRIETVDRPEENRLVVELTAYRLGRDSNMQFVAAYEEGDTMPDPETFALTGSHRVVHTWRRVDGKWMKRSAHYRTLEEVEAFR